MVRFDEFACRNARREARGPSRRHWTASLPARKSKGFIFVDLDHEAKMRLFLQATEFNLSSRNSMAR
jgi:hypothetical protein